MAFAERFDLIIQAITNSELRDAITKLFDVIGVGGSDKRGSVSLTGTVTGNVTGDLTGDVTGNVTGNVTGDVTGDITGVVTGSAGSSLVGDVTGDVTGSATKLVAASAPVNAVAAVGTLTMTGIGVDNEILTIGSDIYEITSGGGLVNGTIEVDCTASHAAADVITNIVAASSGATEAFTLLDSDGDTLTITADVRGVLANSETLTTDFTNGTVDGTGTFADATVTGVDGTAGAIGTTIVTAGKLYVAKAANTIADANWRSIPLPTFEGTGAAPQTIDVTTDLGATDFESDVIFLDGSTACVITDWTPTAGRTYILECADSTADPTVQLSAGFTFNVAGNNKLTFPDADDMIVVKCVSGSRCCIISNNGSVTLSTV
jgi:hypothetical protein